MSLLADLRAFVSLSLLALCLAGVLSVLLVLYAAVRPFSLPLYRRLSSSIAAGPFLDAAALLLPNVRILLAGDSDVPAPVGASVLVCNHVAEGDWWYLLMLGRCAGLGGTMKLFLRSEVLRGQRGSGVAAASSATSGSGPSPAGGGGGAEKGASASTAGGAGDRRLRTAASAPVLRRTSDSGSAAAAAAAAAIAPALSSGVNPRAGEASSRSGSMGGRNGSDASGSDRGGGDAGGGDGGPPPHVQLGGYLLRTLLEYPLLSSESDRSWVARDRAETFALLRSFASPDRWPGPFSSSAAEAAGAAADGEDGGGGGGAAGGGGAGVDSSSPVQFVLFPEGWSLEGGRTAEDRRSVLAKSAEFARREGRPQLRHLLLPRTTGFSASLESLRESSPVVYDVTMAYRGYDGSVPRSSSSPSLPAALWNFARGVGPDFPREIHFRIRRYSAEEVLSDGPRWLDGRWAEKDRTLGHFARHGSFPSDPRGYFARTRAFDTRWHGVEGSLAGLARLGAAPFFVPVLLLLSAPLCLAAVWLYLARLAFLLVFPDWAAASAPGEDGRRWHGFFAPGGVAGGGGRDGSMSAGGGARRTPGSTGGSSLGGLTPFFPATPFASPTHVTNWRPSRSEPHLDRKEGGG